MAQDIVIGGRLHSAATGNTVAGANEILDDAKGKKQNVINQEVDNEIGSDSAAGTIKGRIKNLETAVGSGGSVDERIAETKDEIIGDAATDYNTLGKVEDKIQETKSEILGDAASDYNTLGKVEDKIQAETSRAEAAEGALDNAKANKATTLEGYGIIDAYTKNETYTKTEVNGLVDTPHQNYVTVLTYAALIAIDPGSTDTIYRVSNYDGSVPQVDVTKYSEYAWDGTQYVFLCVKSQIDEVFDISVYNNNATYADLAAALGTDGANVPQTLRRGGMSVKFVSSIDNKYIQVRCMAQNFTTDVTQWQSVDEKPIAGSHNLLESGSILNYTQGIVECKYLPVTDLTVRVTLQEYDFIEGKEYILYYNNTSEVKFVFGIAQNGSGPQTSLADLEPNTKGTYVFTPSSNCNQVRTYAYTINVDGKLDMWIKLKEDAEVLEKNLKPLSEQIDYNSNNIDSINDVINGFSPVNIGSEVDGYYFTRLIGSDGKRHLPVDVSYFKGKNITINLSDVEETSARRIGFTDDISDLSTINWTSFYIESSFQSNVDKLIPITGNYLLISYKRSQNVICKVENGIGIDIISDYFLNKVNVQEVLFDTFTSSTVYSQPIFNFLIGESYLIHYENKSGSSVGFGSGNNGTVVQGGYKTLENNTEGEFLFVPLLNANQIRLYVNSLSSVNGTIKFCVYSDADINPLKNIDKAPTFISCFNKITCIGDSLTSGAYDVNVGGVDGYFNPLYTYPAFLQKHTGVDTINLGLGGRCACRLQDDAQSWYDDIVSAGKFIADNIGDIAIIALGTNDIYKHGSFTGDVSTDIDLADRNNNALTSVGGYANIIQAIREINPRTIIFCVTISNERNTLPTRTAANTKIKAIANLFDECYVIDMQTYAEPSDAEAAYFSLYYKGSSHNNALGYELRSRQMISYIDWIIQHNPGLFGNIQFLGTNYYYIKS